MKPKALPQDLPTEFRTSAARELGATKQRLRASDLERPFRGARIQRSRQNKSLTNSEKDPTRSIYELATERELKLIRALATTLCAGQFFTHRSAALLWEAPVPFSSNPDLHVGVREPQRAPRIKGVTGHEFLSRRVELHSIDNLLLTTPAHTFALLGTLRLSELVAVGDHFARMHRKGFGRRNVGRPAYATLAELNEAVGAGRWKGMPRLRTALELVREDSWSPRESTTRVALVMAGLPEPDLNVDIFDRNGYFLGCLDMVYRRFKIGVEYQGEEHVERYAEDVERFERFRAEGWLILQVTKALERCPTALAARVGSALRARGWAGSLTPRAWR